MHFGDIARCGIRRLVDAIATKIVQSGAELCDAHETEDPESGSACDCIDNTRLPFHGSAKNFGGRR